MQNNLRPLITFVVLLTSVGLVAVQMRDLLPISLATTVKSARKTSFPTTKRYNVAIAIISSFDWEEKPPYVSSQARRQAHRDTWMQHPAVRNEQVLVYFVVGTKEDRRQGDPKNATHKIEELQAEMDNYGDITLLECPDFHNHGKMNAWYEWARLNVQADYHMKLDDESYLHVDHLLSALEQAPSEGFAGGTGMRMPRHWKNHDWNETKELKNLSWNRGWGYIMSEDLVKGLGDCSGSGKIDWNHGEHEDVYNSVALRVCGLDKNITFASDMKVMDLIWVLSQGCPKDSVGNAIVVHGGQGIKVFPKVQELTFARLQDIYYPRSDDLSPSWAKWESLRLLYMEDLRGCHDQKGYWACREWTKHTCIPKRQSR